MALELWSKTILRIGKGALDLPLSAAERNTDQATAEIPNVTLAFAPAHATPSAGIPVGNALTFLAHHFRGRVGDEVGVTEFVSRTS